MKEKFLQLGKRSAIWMLPFLAGCNGGGGGGTALNGLMSQTQIAASMATDAGANLVNAGGAEAALATIHNPEPASMLLMGSGMAAMAYFRRNRTTR